MRVYFESYGCTQNLGEGHALERGAAEAGHAVVHDPAQADVAVLVSCGVIAATEARMARRWRALSAQVPHVVLTGCLVPLRSSALTGPGLERTHLLPIRDQPRLPELLDRLGPAPSAAGASVPEPPALAAEVILAQGCTSGCAYCFSRLARGPLSSVPAPGVLAGVRSAVARGAREVRLSALDTAAWGEDRPDGERLPDLLRAVSGLEGEFTVRVGMMSPQSLLPIAPEYFAALDHPRFFQFLHLPLQSGSDPVLAAMHRGYTVEQFRTCVREARRRLPSILLSTDLIVGYPTEGEEEFRASLAIVGELAPEIVNVTRFSPRPMTPAARLAPWPPGVVKRRSRELTALRMRTARQRLERWVGHEGSALPLERGPYRSTVARLPNYLPVVLAEEPPLGVPCTVRVDGCRSTYLLGHVLPAGGMRGDRTPLVDRSKYSMPA